MSNGDDERRTTLREFFSLVGDGFLSAQERLARRSLEHNRLLDALDREALAPGAASSPRGHVEFKIPSVRARIQIEVTEVNRAEVGILFVEAESKSEERMTQEIEFTIEAAAVPPETAAARRLAFQGDGPGVVPATVQDVLELVRELDARLPDDGGHDAFGSAAEAALGRAVRDTLAAGRGSCHVLARGATRRYLVAVPPADGAAVPPLLVLVIVATGQGGAVESLRVQSFAG